jgi:aspartyl-tRNA(Asn)/glutamyl-tRNA(Gln) amidotransferase subunit B
MPALAIEIRKRLSLRGLSPQDIDMLMAVDSGNDVGLDGQLNDGAVAYFEALAKDRDSKVVVNWCVFDYQTRSFVYSYDLTELLRILHELLGQLSLRRRTFRENSISVEQMGGLIDMIRGGMVTGKTIGWSGI